MGVYTGVFKRGSLRDHLNSLLHRLVQEIDMWDADDLLQTSDLTLVQHLVGEHSAEVPQLQRDGLHQLESRDRVVPTDAVGRSRVRATELTFVVPYVGDQEMFGFRPDTYQSDLGGGLSLLVARDEIHLTGLWAEAEPDAVLRELNRAIDQIEANLGHAKTQVAQHNLLVEETARRRVAERKEHIRGNRSMQNALGIPVRRRDGPPVISVPVNRKKIVPRPEPASPAAPPEFVLEQRDYEEALRVLSYSRSAMERTPLTVAKLGEEEIRNILLVSLNCQFEGKGGGELFNGEGKTDILIRVQDRNVFIGECKIWNGPQAIDGAITQLLRYLVWRDSKAALLVFIRDTEPTSSIQKAIQRIEGHPSHKRTLSAREAEGRYDFVLSAKDDLQREIHLAFLPFVLPIKKAAVQD